jgi:raffinose/stachyose/melibiose transport system permease protein
VRAVVLARRYWLELASLTAILVVFVVPFVFMLLTAAKDRQESARLEFSLPNEWHLLENIEAVLAEQNGIMYVAMANSLILTVASVAITVVLSAMVAFVLQRRRDRVSAVITALMIAGLIIPPALVPTIYTLQWLNINKTLFGLILVEVTQLMPFSVIVFRAFIAGIPRELDEAAFIDGASPLRLFFRVIFPLLRPAVITVIVVTSVTVYNDFVNPLYFLPGADNATVQLTLFNFQGQFSSQWHLLFTDVLLITIPPLIMFMFFQRQIVSGMTTGAIKG